MKKLFTLFIILNSSILFAQHNSTFLDINMVKARIHNNNSNFWDQTGSAQYEAPKGSGKSSIFSEAIWIGGRDPQGNLHLGAQTYRQSGSDFWPGPLDTVNASVDSATIQQYDQLWKIDKFTIDDFIFNFQSGNVANGTYTIPDIILNWPAHGSGNNSRTLAPFADNGDHFYNPLDGDYPLIKGDQMIWWIMNDNFGPHLETDAQRNLGVEIHASAYAYSCPNVSGPDSVINYTTFYHYDFINRSDTDYHDMRIGIFNDIDLGNYLDDYVGCDTLLNIAYAYNGDDNDEGNFGYGNNPPMINLAYLHGPSAIPGDLKDNNNNSVVDETGEDCRMNSFVYFNNDATITGNPNSETDFFGYMDRRWKNNAPMTYGGYGLNSGSTDSVHYMFAGDPFDSTQWSERFPFIGGSSNLPSDRRYLTSSNSFLLNAHSSQSLDYAYIYTRDPSNPNGPTTSFAVNREQVLRIKHFFETDSFPCLHAIGVDEITINEFNIYPNPAKGEIYLTMNNSNSFNEMYSISDITGRQISIPAKIKSQKTQVDISFLSPGIYLVNLQSDKGQSIKKFIVQ